MKSFKAIFRRGQNAKLDGQNTADNISRTSSITNLDVEPQQKGGNKGAKPKKTASRDRLDKIGEPKKNDKKGVTKNNNKFESGDNPYPSIDSLQEEEFLQLRRQLQEMAQEKTNLALQLGEQKGQLNVLQKEIQKLKSFQEESNNKVEYLTEENTMLRNRLRDVAHSPLSDNEKQQLLFDSHRHHSSAPASIATNLIDDGNGGDTTCSTPDWDKHSSSNVSEVSVACLQDKINQMQETHYSTNEELQATLQELTDLQRQLTELQQENERLNEEKTLMMDSLCRQTERLNESRSEVESLKQMLYQEKDDTGQFESVAEREQKLVDLLKSTQEERETLILKLEQINCELHETRSAVLEKDEMIQKLRERIRTLECTLDAKNAEHKQVDQELTQVKDQCSAKHIEINRLTDLLDNAKTKINELEQDRTLSDKSELDEMLDNARKEKDALESEVAHLKEQLAISKNETEKLKEQVSILQEEVKVTRNNAKTTQSDLEYKCEKILKEKTAMNEQLQEFQDAINELQVQSQCQLEDKRQLSAVLSETQRNLSEAERKHINLETEIQELKKLRTEENEEWEKFQNDLLTSVRVANDFKTEAQLELQRMILENKMYRDRERQLKAEIEKLKGQKNQEDTSGTSTSKFCIKENYRMDKFKLSNRNKDKSKKSSENHKIVQVIAPTPKKNKDLKLEPQVKPVKRRENKLLKNKRYKTLSIEEEVLLESLDKWYKNIDSKLSDENLTEEEKVIKKLKIIYEDDHLKTKPVAPKPKDQLAISKPLLDSVMENPKLREILANPNVQTIEDIKNFEEHSTEVRNFIQNIDRLAKTKSEDLTKLTDKKRISIIGRSMSYELKSHIQETENNPGGLYRTFQTEDLRVENTPMLYKIPSVVPSDSVSNISIDTRINEKHSRNGNINFATLEGIVLSIPKNTPHNLLTSEQKFVVKLKEALDEAQRKNTLRKLANIKKLPISFPLVESVLRNPRLKNILYDPSINHIVRRNSDASLSDLYKPIRQSKSCEDITFAFDSHPINMYTENSFREKEKFSSSSSETFSSGELNVETGCVGPYSSENFRDLQVKRFSTFCEAYECTDNIEPQSSNQDESRESDSVLCCETVKPRKAEIFSPGENHMEVVQKVELNCLANPQHSDFCNISAKNDVPRKKSYIIDYNPDDIDVTIRDQISLININNLRDDLNDLKSRENFEYIEKFIEIEKLLSVENHFEYVHDETIFPINEFVGGKCESGPNILSTNTSSLKYESSKSSKIDCDTTLNVDLLDNVEEGLSVLTEANILDSKLDENVTVVYETERSCNNGCDLIYNETLNRIKKYGNYQNAYDKLELINQVNDYTDKMERTGMNVGSRSEFGDLSPNCILNNESDMNQPLNYKTTLLDNVDAISQSDPEISDIFNTYFDETWSKTIEFNNEDISDSFFSHNYSSMFSNDISVPDNPITDLDASLEIEGFTPYDQLVDFSTEVEEYDYHAILRENKYGVTSPLHLRVTFKDVVKEIKARFSKDDDDSKKFEENIGEDKQDDFYNRNSKNIWHSNSITNLSEYKNAPEICGKENRETHVISGNLNDNFSDEIKLEDYDTKVNMSVDQEMEEILENYLNKPVSKIISEPPACIGNLECAYYKLDQNVVDSKNGIRHNSVSQISKLDATDAKMSSLVTDNENIESSLQMGFFDTSKEKFSLLNNFNLKNISGQNLVDILPQHTSEKLVSYINDIENFEDLHKMNKNEDKSSACDLIDTQTIKPPTKEEIQLVRMSQMHQLPRPLSDFDKTDIENIKEISMNYPNVVQEPPAYNLNQEFKNHSNNLKYIQISNFAKSDSTRNMLPTDEAYPEGMDIKKKGIFDNNDNHMYFTYFGENRSHANEFEIAHQEYENISGSYVGDIKRCNVIDEKDYQLLNTASLSPNITRDTNLNLDNEKLDTSSKIQFDDCEKNIKQNRDDKQKCIVSEQDNQLKSHSKIIDTVIENNSVSLKSSKDYIKLQVIQNPEIKFKINPFRTKEENRALLYPKKVKSVADHFEKISLITNYEPVYCNLYSVKFANQRQLQKTAEKKPLPLPRSRNQESQESDKNFDTIKAVDIYDNSLKGTEMTDLEENFSDHESENVMPGITCPDINRIESSKVEVTEVPGLHETQKLLPETVQEIIDEENNNSGGVVAIRKSEKFLEHQIAKEDSEKNVDDQHNLACGADPSFSSIAVAGKVENLDLTKPSISDVEEINTENASNLNLFHLDTPSLDESYLSLFKAPEEHFFDHYGKKKLPKSYVNVAYLSEGSDNESSEEVDRKKIGYKYLEEGASKPKIIDFVPLDDATKPVFNKDNLMIPSYDTLERETAFHILNAAASSAKERKSFTRFETDSGGASQKTSSKTSFSAAKKVFEALVEANSDKNDLNTCSKNRSIEKESSSGVGNSIAIVNDQTNNSNV